MSSTNIPKNSILRAQCQTIDTSSIDLHIGLALLQVASAYPTLLAVILEIVQNALDANARRIDLLFNRQKRNLAIRDDGDGVGRDDFERALRSICRTQKQDGKLGQFGIGLISPLDKCRGFRFTSCPKGSSTYLAWTFITALIKEQAADVSVPCKEVSSLRYIPEGVQIKAVDGVTDVWWRTEVNVADIYEDRHISRIDSIDYLKEAILSRFSATMRRNKVVLNIKFIDESGNAEQSPPIRAKQFTGRQLPEIIVDDAYAGRVTFRLYQSTPTVKGLRGVVLVGKEGDEFRFPLARLIRSAENGKLLDRDVAEALLSGVFEGEILGQKVWLAASRTAFKENDALIGFLDAIEKWFRKFGHKHFEESTEKRREKRYQDLGLASLMAIKDMLDQPAFASMLAALGDLKIGSIGRGHADPGDEAVIGLQSEKSLAVKGEKGAGKMRGPEQDSATPEERESHMPLTAAGPRGKQRANVKHGSFGIQFSYVSVEGSDCLWTFDVRAGILRFNINHPRWADCDSSDRKLRQLQETVALMAIMRLSIPADAQTMAAIELMLEELVAPLIFLYHNSRAFVTGRAPTSK